MDNGMEREEAERLAATVHGVSRHPAEVKPDGDFFVVEVRKQSANGTDTFTLYDEDDWSWLRDRIEGP